MADETPNPDTAANGPKATENPQNAQSTGAASKDVPPSGDKKTAEKPALMTQEQLVAFATAALDKSLEATIPDAAQRQAAVEKAATAFSEALAEGLKLMPGASLSQEKAAEIISIIQKEQAQLPDWNGKVGDKPIADMVKEAATSQEESKGMFGSLADKAKDHPAITAAGALALTAAAAKFMPNKEAEQPDGSVKKKMGFVKKAVVALLGIVTMAAAVEFAKPGSISGLAGKAGDTKWRDLVKKPAAAAQAAGQGI